MSDFKSICTQEMIENPTAEVVLRFREVMGLSQPDAAKQAGLSRRGWQHAEAHGMKSQTFELLLLKTDQHPFMALQKR